MNLPLPSTVVRALTLVSGVAAIVLANLADFHLPVADQATITGIGGVLLSILAYLEHPSTVAANAARTTQPSKPAATAATTKTGS